MTHPDHPKDICYCGDYREQHEGGTGRCKLGSLCTPAPSCHKFRLSRGHQEASSDRRLPPMPDPFTNGYMAAIHADLGVPADTPFSLDTSGIVLPFARYDPKWNAEPCGYRWTDLDPFTQGYIEAMFASLSIDIIGQWLDTVDPYRTPGFRDLAPETLAAILKDCAAYQALRTVGKFDGGDFWRERQAGLRADFPPQTPFLSDDGRIYLRGTDA